MTGQTLYDAVLLAIFCSAAVVLVALLLLTAPYGRHGRQGWGPGLPVRTAWMIFESPAVLAFAWFYWQGPQRLDPVPLLLLALWLLHYLQRAVLYPLSIRPRRSSKVPLAVVLMSVVFNLANAYTNARWLSDLGHYPSGWLADWRLWSGIALFAAGYATNRWADSVLRKLRSESTGYKIPRGLLYERISCPNYLGEIMQWCGWAVATWSLAGLAFALFTVANLAPRALAHHRWYRERFPDYPAQRRALVPFIL